MYNYAEYGLILMPTPETYQNKEEHYYTLFDKTVNNIVKFLKSKGIIPVMLMSDEVANLANPDGVQWVQTFLPSDFKFIQKVESIYLKREDPILLDDLYAKTVKKYPSTFIADPEELYARVVKRTNFIENAYIKDSRVIFNIFTHSKANHNIKSKEGSPAILVNVSNATFQPTAYIGGMEVNAAQLLDIVDGCLPVCEWRI